MAITHCKMGDGYSKSAMIFGCSTDKMKRTVEGMISKIDQEFYNNLVQAFSMRDYRSLRQQFPGFPSAIEAIDVTLQKSVARGSTFSEKKLWWSGKHWCYGIKTEVAVGPDGRARWVGKSFPGSVHDMKMFRHSLVQHRNRLRKRGADINEQDPDFDENFDQSGQEDMYWMALADKGYQGASVVARIKTPKKKTAQRILDRDDIRSNKQIERARVIVENYFGRLKSLWGQMRTCYKLKQDMYNPFFRFCCALTNWHLTFLPLRAEDGNFEENYILMLREQQKQAQKRRDEQSRSSNARPRQRMFVSSSTASLGGDIEALGSGDAVDVEDSDSADAE